MKKIRLLSFLLIFTACSNNKVVKNHPEFKSFFEEYQVEGSFLLYEFAEKKTIVFNEARCSQGFIPASTFKIAHTLIGLETGVITGENFIIPWDSVPRQVPLWNKDHTLASAFQNSVVPWYQELARQIGPETMNFWVSRSQFGQMNIQPDNIDLFWLTGASRITPYEQLEFQKRLIQNQLPFSPMNIDLVKKIMILEQTQDYTLRGKTGWAVMGDKNIGWLVGYLEKEDQVYAYVLNVESENQDAALFQKSRTEIVHKIFKTLSLI